MEVTREARNALEPGEALVFDWHRVAICCAVAGEVSLRRTSLRQMERSRSFVSMTEQGETPVFAHRRAYAHLAGRPIRIDCRRRFGLRRFTSNLPPDFGLRAEFGHLPEEPEREGQA